MTASPHETWWGNGAALAAAMLTACLSRPDMVASSTSVVLHDVHVVDLDQAAIRAHQDVTITDGTITAVRASKTGSPHGAAGIDASGAYLIPGLWDMHVHLSASGPDSLPLFVANGVLGVRDMGTDLAVVNEWLRGGRVAPRIIPAGAVIESERFLAHVEQVDRIVAAHGVAPLAFTPPVVRVGVASAEQVPATLDRIVAAGGQFVKARTYESPAVFFAIAREARRRGLPFAGHSPPEGVSWGDATGAGMTSIEHMGGSYAAQLGQLAPADRRALSGRMIQAGAFVDPNVICEVIRAMPDARAKDLVHATAAGPLTYNPWIPRQLKDVFRRELAIRILEKEVEATPDWDAISRQEFTLLKELSSHGVPVLAGTDLGSLLTYPGFSLHDELRTLVETIGLSPAQALRAATSAPARFFKAADWGRIAPGQRADVVLLDADPLADISNTRRIRGVVVGGKYYNRSALDSLLDLDHGH